MNNIKEKYFVKVYTTLFKIFIKNIADALEERISELDAGQPSNCSLTMPYRN